MSESFQKKYFILSWFQKKIVFKKILSNTAYQVLAKAFTAWISIILLNLLTNYLPIELFWEYGKVYNYLLIFAFLADLWLYTISIREINKYPEKAEKIVWNIMTLRVLLWMCIIALSLIIASILPWYNSTLTLLAISIVGIFTLFSLINSSILALMQAHLRMRFSFFSAVFWKLVNLISIGAIIYIIYPQDSQADFFYPFLAIMCAGLAWNIVTTILNVIYAKKITPIHFLYDWGYIKKIFITSIPYGLAIFLWVVYMKVDIILLSLIESPEKANISIALYSVPMKILEVFMVTGTFFLNSLLPSLSSDYKKWATKNLEKTLTIAYKFLLLSSAGMLVFGMIFKDFMVRTIANARYLDRTLYEYTSSDAFVIVLFMVVFYFMFLIFQYIFIATEKQGKLLKINIYITLFNIIWNIILIPKYSFVGAGIITVLSQAILMILWYYYSKDIVRFKIPIFYSLWVIATSFLVYLFLIHLLPQWWIS